MDFMWSQFDGGHVTGAAKAAKGATPPCIPRSSVAMALAEARHHNAPRGQMTVRAEATYDALRSQRDSVARDTEFFSLYEDELGGTLPDRLACVRPHVHTLEHVADVCPSVQTLDASVPQMGKELLDVFRLLDTVLPEQVIDVPKISQDSIQLRLVDRDHRLPQVAVQLVEVRTVLSVALLKQQIAEQTIDIPVLLSLTLGRQPHPQFRVMRQRKGFFAFSPDFKKVRSPPRVRVRGCTGPSS